MDEDLADRMCHMINNNNNPMSNYYPYPSTSSHAVSDNLKLLQQVVDGGIDINTRGVGAEGSTALHVIAKNGNQRIAEHLLNKGATVDVTDYLGNTPLIFAVSKHFTELTKLLLDKGANVNAQNIVGLSPLHIAVSHSYIELARDLIRHGANTDSRTADGCTPLHIVVHNIFRDRENSLDSSSSVNIELCKLLISENANLNIADSCGNTALHLAVKGQCVSLTELLLTRDLDIDLCNNEGSTPLHLAFSHDTPTMANLLLNKGASVNLPDRNGNTLLHLLIAGNMLPCYFDIFLRKLFDMGVNINKKNIEGNTVLMLAIKRKLSQDMIIFLINRGADVNVQNNEGDTPLLLSLKYLPTHLAVISSPFSSFVSRRFFIKGITVNMPKCDISASDHLAKLILSKVRAIDDKDSPKITPLMVAESKNFTKLIKLCLEKGANVNEQNYIGLSPLHIAVSHGYIELARDLIRHGANINSRTTDGSTPLHIAVHFFGQYSFLDGGNSLGSSPLVSFVELCKLLICEGADLNIADVYGNTVLHLAVKLSNVILTEMLLSKNGAIDINLCNVQGNTPLHMAFRCSTPTHCNLLLNKGANVNFPDSNGNTPLHLLILGNKSSLYCDTLLCKFLYMGANINKKNFEGDTVLMLAIKHNLSRDMIIFLINRGADINVQNNEGDTPLLLALKYLPTRFTIISGNLILNKVPEKLILRGANVNTKNNEGNTPLHIACTKRFIDEVDLLLKSGCDVNVQNRNGDTPLHIAMYHVDFYLLQTFLERTGNSDLNIQNRKGDTPLHNAVMVAANGNSAHTRTIHKLIDNGAWVDIKNNDNKTPFHVAKMNSEAEKVVVEHITKMRVAGLPVGISSEIRDEDMEVKCLEEMEKIKVTKINEKHSLDILFSSNRNPRYLVKSEEFVENLMATPVLEEMFPQYSSLLRIQFKLARERLHLLNRSHYSLEGRRKFIYLQNLPFETKQIIFDYLENEDLKSLIKCMQNSKKMLYF